MMAAQSLADAAVRAGFYAHAFPYFGAERRGAPVQAYARIDTEKVRTKSQVHEPDLLVIMDESLSDLNNIAAGLKPGGKVVMNTTHRPEEVDLGAGVDAECGTVDATAVALEVLKMPVVNTAMLGALSKVWDEVPLDTVVEAIEDRFGEKLGSRAGVLNGEAARMAYEATVIGRTVGSKVYGQQKEWLPPWYDIPIGTALRHEVHEGLEIGPGSSWQNLTGMWKWSTPMYTKEKCIKCLRCWWSCPDGAIIRLDDDFMHWDMSYCKGCGVCADMCPVNAIEMVRGEHHW